MVEKYNLHDVAIEMDELDLEEMREQFEGENVNYTHELLIKDVIAYRKSSADYESTKMTPWGEVWSEAFQAYFNNFPVELFSEPEESACYTQV